MTLIFGQLTQDYVRFAVAVSQANQGNAQATAELPAAAAGFRHVAAQDASHLVFIGTEPPTLDYCAS